jgi:GNAT superfamily N-acetyltransferase
MGYQNLDFRGIGEDLDYLGKRPEKLKGREKASEEVDNNSELSQKGQKVVREFAAKINENLDPEKGSDFFGVGVDQFAFDMRFAKMNECRFKGFSLFVRDGELGKVMESILDLTLEDEEGNMAWDFCHRLVYEGHRGKGYGKVLAEINEEFVRAMSEKMGRKAKVKIAVSQLDVLGLFLKQGYEPVNDYDRGLLEQVLSKGVSLASTLAGTIFETRYKVFYPDNWFVRKDNVLVRKAEDREGHYNALRIVLKKDLSSSGDCK